MRRAWIALGAYPWNWAPIVAREDTVSLGTHLDAFSWPESTPRRWISR